MNAYGASPDPMTELKSVLNTHHPLANSPLARFYLLTLTFWSGPLSHSQS